MKKNASIAHTLKSTTLRESLPQNSDAKQLKFAISKQNWILPNRIGCSFSNTCAQMNNPDWFPFSKRNPQPFPVGKIILQTDKVGIVLNKGSSSRTSRWYAVFSSSSVPDSLLSCLLSYSHREERRNTLYWVKWKLITNILDKGKNIILIFFYKFK